MSKPTRLLVIALSVINLALAAAIVAPATAQPEKHRGKCSSCLNDTGQWYGCCPNCLLICDCTRDDEC